MGEGLGAEVVMRLELLQGSFVGVPKFGYSEPAGSDCRLSLERIDG